MGNGNSQASDQGDMKKCPFCAESIKKEAIFCRYCRCSLVDNANIGNQGSGTGSDIVTRGYPQPSTAGFPKPPVKSGTGSWKAMLLAIIAAIAVILVGVGIYSYSKKTNNQNFESKPAEFQEPDRSIDLTQHVKDLKLVPAKPLPLVGDEFAIHIASKVATDLYGPFNRKLNAWIHKVKDPDLFVGMFPFGMQIAVAERVMSDGEETIHIILSGSPVVDGDFNRSFSGLISYLVVKPIGYDRYTVLAQALEVKAGDWGQAPRKFTKVQVGNGVTGWVYRYRFGDTGEFITQDVLMMPFDGAIKTSRIQVRYEYTGSDKIDIKGTYTFDENTIGKIYTLKYTSQGICSNKKIKKNTKIVPFNYHKGVYEGSEDLAFGGD